MSSASRSETFLRNLRLTGDCIDSAAALQLLDTEIEKGLKGMQGGLLMIPSLSFPDEGIVYRDLECIAVDIGGTTLKCARVRMDRDGKMSLSDVKAGSVPGLGSPVTEREFFSRIAAFAGVNADTENLAVSFSHYMKPLPGCDAQILGWCKETAVTESSGRSIAQLFREVSGNTELNCRVTNDSVASMLGCSGSFDGGAFLGLIVGTGFNICWKDGSGMLYNTEMGDSAAFPQGIIDRETDLASACPGGAAAEKLVSGVYLEKIISGCITAAAEQGIISDASPFADLTLKEYCGLLNRVQDGDSAFAADIVRAALERSARIAALCCCALIRRNSPDIRSVLIGTEGSVINKAPGYREQFLKELERELGPDISITLKNTGYAGLKGAAMLMCL